MLKFVFTKSPPHMIVGATVFGSTSKRTMYDYLHDAKTDCAQAAQGEMTEWLQILQTPFTTL